MPRAPRPLASLACGKRRGWWRERGRGRAPRGAAGRPGGPHEAGAAMRAFRQAGARGGHLSGPRGLLGHSRRVEVRALRGSTAGDRLPVIGLRVEIHRLCYMRLPPLLHAVTASATCGYRLCHMRMQPLLHAVTASATYGYRLCYMRLQPLLRAVTASATCGCRLCYIRLQPLLHTVTASATCGCRLCYIQ